MKKLVEELPRAAALYFDDRNYDSDSGIDDICRWVEEGADVDRFNLDMLAEDIERLIEGNPDYIILDYPFGYRHRAISKYIDYSIFIDTPLDIALARRIIRDYGGKTVRDVCEDMEHYLSRGRSAYLYGLDRTKLEADFVVDGSRSPRDIVSLITEHLIHMNCVQ